MKTEEMIPNNDPPVIEQDGDTDHPMSGPLIQKAAIGVLVDFYKARREHYQRLANVGQKTKQK